jgi:hypothetical protein
MMKKFFTVFVLLLALPLFAFANHPSGWGLGIMGQYNLAWDGFAGAGGAAFSLKTPQLPVYWGINLEMRNHSLGFSLTGDYYLVDRTISRDINLGWYLGVGAYAGFHSYDYESIKWTSIRGGARVPIGIYIIPVRFLEVFLDIAPSLGVGLYFGNWDDRFNFPEGGFGVDIGLRFWL